MSTTVVDSARKHHERIVEIRRRIHAEPELAFEEVKTAALVAEELKAVGHWTVRTGIGKTGVLADLEGPKGSPRVAFRADMDALPVTEDPGESFVSKRPGAAHVCGHDAHTAMLLGAARLLAERRADLPVSIRLIFQPSEEKPPGGAPLMIREGALDGVDEVYGIHVAPEVPAGFVATREGPLMAQSDRFDMVITGRGGHGATPHLVLDPVPVAAEIVLALQTLRARRVAPTDPVVVTVGKISGGETFNQVPDSVTLIGTVRTLTKATSQDFPGLLQKVARGIAEAHGCRFSCAYQQGYPPLVNHASAVARAKAAVSAALGTDRFLTCEPTMYGEDFAHYLEEKPGAFLFLGMRKGEEEIQGCHSPRFRLNEEVLPLGPALVLALALGFGK